MTQSTRNRTVAMLAACVLFASGCAGMNVDARKILQKPLDCENASGQVQALQDSRADAVKRITQGLQGIMPPMIVLSLFRDIFIAEPYRSIYLDHWRVAFGSYNDKIDARVGKLQSCE